MKATKRGTSRAAVALAVAALVSTLLPAAAEGAQRARRAPSGSTVTVPANQYIRVRMNHTLNSEEVRVGDRFTTTIVEPVTTRGVVAIPAGASVEGRVTYVKPARSRSQGGAIGVRFDRLVLRDGTRYNISGTLTEVLGEGDLTDEGVLEGESVKKKNLYILGGGAAGGALLGGLIGGGDAAAAGAIIGAGAAAAKAAFGKGKEAKIERDAEVGVVLERPVRVRVPR